MCFENREVDNDDDDTSERESFHSVITEGAMQSQPFSSPISATLLSLRPNVLVPGNIYAKLSVQ